MMTSKLLIVAIFGAFLLSSAMAAANKENHVGYELIKNLQLEALNIINEIEDQWKGQSALLQRGISSWENTVNQQTALCESRGGDLAKTDKDIETTEAYIQWIQNKIQENNDRVQTLEEWRCTANTLYVNGIKNNKLTLSLIEYLYRELSNAKNLEMLQKSHIMTKLTVFIEAYKLGNVAALLDAPVFAQFKSHLKNADGEDQDADEEFGADDEEALDEIEEELESDSEDSESYENSEDNEEGDGEGLVTLGGHDDEADGEWEDEDEEDDDEEEFEDDEEEEEDEGLETTHQSSEDSEEGEHHGGGEHHVGSGHHGESGDEEHGEPSAKGHHHFEGGSKGEQHHAGAPSSWTHTEWDVDTTSWPQFKKDLLDILVQLRNSIIHKMRTAQDDEVNAGIALADYKVIIHRENEDLAKALVNQQNRLEDLLVLQTKQQIKVTECQAELSTVSDSLYASRAEFDNSEAQFTENRKAAVEERDVYDYVVSLYEGKVEDRFRFKGDNRNSRQMDNINF